MRVALILSDQHSGCDGDHNLYRLSTHQSSEFSWNTNPPGLSRMFSDYFFFRESKSDRSKKSGSSMHVPFATKSHSECFTPIYNREAELVNLDLQQEFSIYKIRIVQTSRSSWKLVWKCPGIETVILSEGSVLQRAFESLCSSTHLYGRRLVLEWAEDEDSVDALRKRTAEHFHGSILCEYFCLFFFFF